MPRQKSRRIAAIVAAVAAAIAIMAVWLANERAESNAIRELSERDRRALYERTLHTLESSCDPEAQPIGLGAFCRKQAEFIVQFPECDQTCMSLARRHQLGPAR